MTEQERVERLNELLDKRFGKDSMLLSDTEIYELDAEIYKLERE